MDMYKVMKAFCEIGYQGTMILDHSPQFAPGYHPGARTAYAIGYMRALVERAEAELYADCEKLCRAGKDRAGSLAG